MTGPVLHVHDAERVRTITFNRPQAANAFDSELSLAAAGSLAAAAVDDGVSVVVLTGAGRTFCAGTDLVEMAALVAALGDEPAEGGGGDAAAPTDAARPGSHFNDFLDVLSTFPKPLLAAVNGAGVGLGFTMLLHCDLVLMADSARLQVPFSAMGVAPEAASSYLLPLRTNRQQAALTLFTSRWVSAHEAVDQGIALRVCDTASVLAETQRIATEIARYPLPSLVAIKELLLESEAEGVRRARQSEDDAFSRLLRLPGKEGDLQRHLRGARSAKEET